MKFKHLLLILILLLVIGLILVDFKKSENPKIYENGTIAIYFCPQDNCDEKIINEIDSSQLVKCAFFELTKKEVIYALKEKNASIIIHDENFKDLGISRETDGLMHSKFCVLDNKKIITGSHNPTMNENKDNLLIIESKYLATNYNNEFKNLETGLLGLEKKKTKYTHIIFNNYELENYFCPQDSCQKEILEELDKANSSIYFLTFTFTDKEIASVLANKKTRGLDVKGVIESYQGKTYWVYPQLIEADISVVLDEEQSLQHNKIFIIDNTTVITGSFNPTKAANTKNDENIIIIRQPDVVKKYVDEFERLYVELQE
ncbi:MAG: phospholipase D-like domain-containing protein [Candidatus Woesearchaeota archaeon]|jgi:phosphatidylserine/phosphatidylglycerophosphate/cardiolipin synthase-like enzyme